MKKGISFILTALIMAVSVFSASVSADMGPKDSVNISFKNMGAETCYCTLLSDNKSTGPFSASDSPKKDDEIDTVFFNYKDADGFYYLHFYSRIDSSKEFEWGYYPPRKFKILLYYPATNTFAVSGIYDHYAFSSFYTVDMRDIHAGADNQILTAERKYSPLFVVFAFIMRVIITLAVEIAIAIPFGFREKKQLLSIIIINVITQLFLNFSLYNVMLRLGSLFILLYIPLEFVVFIIEVVFYVSVLRIVSKTRVRGADCVLYAFLGNFASFFGGVIAAIFFPWVAM